MSMFRVALLTTAAFFLLPPSHANAQDPIEWGMGKTETHSLALAKTENSVEVQFLGGTVKTIPADTFGMLNLKDTTDLRFQYGTTVFRVPYTQITETEVTEVNKGHWLVHMPRKKRYQTLVIAYRDTNGAENTLNFQVNSRLGGAVEAFITSRREGLLEATADPDASWGDNIWKTKRTLANWEQKPKPASPALAVGAGGTK